MIDYLIIGSGLAGVAFAETAFHNCKDILLIDNQLSSASKVAAGLYNPVILKRFSAVWNSQQQLEILDDFFGKIESRFNVLFDHKSTILRRFSSIEEQNNWYAASDKIELRPFMSTVIRRDLFDGLDSPYDFGEVKNTGYVDVAYFLDCYCKSLKDSNLLQIEDFKHELLSVHPNYVKYKNIEAKHIVFAEGFGMKKNPFFQDLPLIGVKGELLIIEAEDLKLDLIVNAGIFILPIGENKFKIGATYDWNDKTTLPTSEGKQELVDKLKEIITCDFKVIHHFAGIRPTVKDRRPLVGTHNMHSNVHLLNGLGTRGVMIAPSMAKALFEHIESQVPLSPEINIARFLNK